MIVNWFAVVFTAAAIIVGGIANNPSVWAIIGLLVIGVWLFRALFKKEAKAIEQDIWEDIFTFASFVQQQRSKRQADQDQDSQ